ncbi:hypothetical protein C2845_PM01G36350 [Panicum miliaceum]|uniref:Uncharacterized protein n=1 Tax=Panicum miliaceum TaxID=4540 RepID=A0A3L6TQ00_PANMI|nr:hypothetical protein C2845_PM01G36350 [Panicum miliaceum]
MAGLGTPLLRASAFAAAIDGSVTIVAADDPVEELARRRGRAAANRGPAQREIEDDAARGWSSAVRERGLALRRRGGSAASCSRRRGLVRAAGEERGCRSEEAAAPGAVVIGAEAAAVAKAPVAFDPMAFFCVAVL